MASSLNSKRTFLLLLAIFGLIAGTICAVLLAVGVREPTRERLFLVGSIFIVSIVCLFLSIHFKGEAQNLESSMKEAEYKRLQKEGADPDEVALPQNQTAQSDPDDIQLPQNR
jgi:hypothetical protein